MGFLEQETFMLFKLKVKLKNFQYVLLIDVKKSRKKVITM